MDSSQSQFRPLTQSERQLLDRLLESNFPGRNELREQVNDCLVRPVDEHGCLEFMTSANVKAPVEGTVPVEAEGKDADGALIGVLLFVKDGKVTDLEFNRWDGSPIVRLPSATQWHVIQPD